MQTCQESATYLHSLGISDTKLADICNVTRTYMNLVRNGKRQGSPELQATLNELHEEALHRQIPVKHSAQHFDKKRRTSKPATIVDAVPATNYSTSQEVISYVTPEEAPKNRMALAPTFRLPSTSQHPSIEAQQAEALDKTMKDIKSLLRAARNTPASLAPINSPETYRNAIPDSTSKPRKASSPQQMTDHPSTWQRIKAAYARGNEIQREDRKKRRS